MIYTLHTTERLRVPGPRRDRFTRSSCGASLVTRCDSNGSQNQGRAVLPDLLTSKNGPFAFIQTEVELEVRTGEKGRALYVKNELVSHAAARPLLAVPAQYLLPVIFTQHPSASVLQKGILDTWQSATSLKLPAPLEQFLSDISQPTSSRLTAWLLFCAQQPGSNLQQYVSTMMPSSDARVALISMNPAERQWLEEVCPDLARVAAPAWSQVDSYKGAVAEVLAAAGLPCSSTQLTWAFDMVSSRCFSTKWPLPATHSHPTTSSSTQPTASLSSTTQGPQPANSSGGGGGGGPAPTSVPVALFAPVADLLNHDFRPNCDFEMAADGSALQVRARMSWATAASVAPVPVLPADSELLISYGQLLGNAALLVKYGFCARANPNARLDLPAAVRGAGIRSATLASAAEAVVVGYMEAESTLMTCSGGDMVCCDDLDTQRCRVYAAVASLSPPMTGAGFTSAGSADFLSREMRTAEECLRYVMQRVHEYAQPRHRLSTNTIRRRQHASLSLQPQPPSAAAVQPPPCSLDGPGSSGSTASLSSADQLLLGEGSEAVWPGWRAPVAAYRDEQRRLYGAAAEVLLTWMRLYGRL